MKRREEITIFSMSFLDCICCGFGATILIFVLMKHARLDPDYIPPAPRMQVSGLEDQLLDERQKLLVLRAALDDVANAQELAESEMERLRKKIEEARSALPQDESGKEAGRARRIVLENELKALESRAQEMRAAAKDNTGDAVRNVQGEARRQYLTGLTVQGDHILVLVDTSASMLADTIVEAIRRRNMDDSAKLASFKWRRAVAAVDWMAAQMPSGSQFQMYGFNEKTAALVPGSEGQWLPVKGGQKLDQAIAALRRTPPAEGTSLARAFQSIGTLRPRPDNVYLVTDGLPTMGTSEEGGTISGRERVKFFNEALNILPRDIPVHVVLLPMEGDPKAASAYWQLARSTGGTLLIPSKDWP